MLLRRAERLLAEVEVQRGRGGIGFHVAGVATLVRDRLITNRFDGMEPILDSLHDAVLGALTNTAHLEFGEGNEGDAAAGIGVRPRRPKPSSPSPLCAEADVDVDVEDHPSCEYPVFRRPIKFKPRSATLVTQRSQPEPSRTDARN
jgi:hypothetical protein